MLILEEPEHAFMSFHDHSYRWIDVKCFRWDGLGEDRAILDALIHRPHYRDTYISPDSHEHDSETVHGPYRVDEISPEDFEGISSAVAQAVVDEFCNLYQSPPVPEVLQEIESMIQPRLRSASCYRLRQLPHAEHEFSSILLEFRELVAISRGNGEVSLIVMAID